MIDGQVRCTICGSLAHQYRHCPEHGTVNPDHTVEKSKAAARRLLQECGLTKARVLASFAPRPAMPRLCDCDVRVEPAFTRTEWAQKRDELP